MYRVLRRRVAEGGTVTVITDITEQKEAQRDLAYGEAEDGQILVSPRIFTKLETRIEAVSVGELTLKGFQRTVLAHNVLGVRPEE